MGGNCKGFSEKGQNDLKMAQNGVFGQKGRKGQKKAKNREKRLKFGQKW